MFQAPCCAKTVLAFRGKGLCAVPFCTNFFLEKTSFLHFFAQNQLICNTELTTLTNYNNSMKFSTALQVRFAYDSLSLEVLLRFSLRTNYTVQSHAPVVRRAGQAKITISFNMIHNPWILVQFSINYWLKVFVNAFIHCWRTIWPICSFRHEVTIILSCPGGRAAGFRRDQ